MDVLKQINRFEQLNKHNDQALEQLQLMISSKPSNPVTAPKQLFKSIREMYSCLEELAPKKSQFYKGYSHSKHTAKLKSKIFYIQKEIKKKISLADVNAYSKDNKDVTSISPHVKSSLEHTVMQSLDSLSPDLIEFSAAKPPPVETLKTPHDLIRYMHQAGTEFLFNPNNGEEWEYGSSDSVYIYDGSRMRLRLISLTQESNAEYFKKNPFLQRIKHIADKEKFETSEKHSKFYALGKEDILSFQFQLGYHFASLQIREENHNSNSQGREENTGTQIQKQNKREDKTYTIKFMFRDTTTYTTSKFRNEVSELILKSQGYKVNRRKNVMKMEETGPLKESLDCFEMLLRFSACTGNVDVLNSMESVEGRVEDTALAFNAGVINLHNYIENEPKGSYISYAKEKKCYLGKLSTEVEERIKHIRLLQKKAKTKTKPKAKPKSKAVPKPKLKAK